MNSTLFGIMSVLLIFVAQPFAQGLVTAVPTRIRVAVSAGLLAYFAADCAVTVQSMKLLNLRLEALSEALAAVKERLDISGFSQCAQHKGADGQAARGA